MFCNIALQYGTLSQYIINSFTDLQHITHHSYDNVQLSITEIITSCDNFGKWLDLFDYWDKDEFMEACRELHKDEQDPEYMFQDYENVPESLISESWLSDKFFEVRDAIEKLSETEQEAFFVWCDHHNSDISGEDADDLISSFEDDYQGEYKDEEDYAYEIVEQCYELPEFAKTYFDYSAFARDLFMTDYWMEDGFVFRCA